MAASKLAKFMPSPEFLSNLKSSSLSRQKFFDRILKELELVDYFHSKVPETITDTQWEKLLKTTKVHERVSMIEYFALTERRRKMDLEKKEKKSREFQEAMEQANADYAEGKMAYAAGLHQMILNPLRNDRNINLVEGFRQYTTQCLRETPNIAFDCQYFKELPVKDSSQMAAQVDMCLNINNVVFRRPFEFEFLNFDTQQSPHKTPLDNVIKYFNQKHSHQSILPNAYKDMHYKPGDRTVYYVTKDAKQYFDGPLDPNSTIILPATTDRKHEALAVAKKFRFNYIYLPIRKYIKWEVGFFYLPLPNILRTFKMVSESGGDWESAVNANVAHRHKISIEQRRESMKGEYDRRQQLLKERAELIQMIENTIKN